MSKVVGTTKAVRAIAEVRRAAVGILSDEAIANLILARVKGRFMQGVAPDGSPWPGLMEDTVARKVRAGNKNPGQLLYATGRLYRSLQIIRGSHQGLLGSSTGVGFRVGIAEQDTAEYGRLHNYGITQEKRQFIGLGRLDVVAVRGMLARKLKSIAKG